MDLAVSGVQSMRERLGLGPSNIPSSSEEPAGLRGCLSQGQLTKLPSVWS